MTQAELKNKILEKSIPHLMIWESKSLYFDNLYIDRIKTDYNLDVVFLDEKDDFVEIYRNTFVKKLYVLRMTTLNTLQNTPECPRFNFFVIIVENIGSAEESALKCNLTRFTGFDSSNVGSLLKDNYPLNTAQAKKVSELLKNDIYKCILELDKVSMLDGDFVENLNLLTNKDIMDFDIPFDEFGLINNIINKNKSAISDMQEFLDNNSNVIGFLTILYNTYKNILQIKCQHYTDVNEIEKCTGIKSGAIYAIKNKYIIDNFSEDYLEERMSLCSSLIDGIKNGIYTEQEAFYYACLF